MTEQKVFSKSLLLMENSFQISGVADNEDWANERMDAAIHEIQRIEKLLTTYNENRF